MTQHLSPRGWDSHPPYVFPGYKSTVKRGPTQPLVTLKAALGELAQPVYGHDLIGELDHDLTRNAIRNGEPLGAVWLQVVEKLPNPTAEPELHAYVSNFYVRPAYRNDGIGSALLRVVLDECTRLDVDSVFLWPSERSRALYERHGFITTDSVLVLKR